MDLCPSLTFQDFSKLFKTFQGMVKSCMQWIRVTQPLFNLSRRCSWRYSPLPFVDMQLCFGLEIEKGWGWRVSSYSSFNLFANFKGADGRLGRDQAILLPSTGQGWDCPSHFSPRRGHISGYKDQKRGLFEGKILSQKSESRKVTHTPKKFPGETDSTLWLPAHPWVQRRGAEFSRFSFSPILMFFLCQKVS